MAAPQVCLAALHAFHVLNGHYRNSSIIGRAAFESQLIYRPDSFKLFHAYIRNKKVGCPAVGHLKLSTGELIVDSGQMRDNFAAPFSGVYVSEASAHPEPFQLCGVEFDMCGVFEGRCAWGHKDAGSKFEHGS